MYQHLPSPVQFREDINGLRAWAVIAVLLFHFSLIGLSGGFAGVDIFFVISGYLMTAIIVRGYESGNFSLLKFYMARIRRILPALMVTITSLLILGWFFLLTPDYQELGKQSAYSLAFLSNIGYWRSAGYFDSAAHEKWLLHTWSLAVEAQFYLLYPLFFASVWKFFKNIKALSIALVIILIASLLLSVLATPWKPTGSFYLLPTRGWELAAGGLVYLATHQGVVPKFIKEKGYWLGWLLVFGSFIYVDESFAWPGYWASLPVLGASLIILGQRQNCKLTDNLFAQWLGDRSYSLYLWHWPLVVVLYYVELQSEWTWVIAAFALSVFLAHLSYRFVETPTRNYLTQSSLKKEIIVIISVGFLIGLASVSVKKFNFEGRMPKAAEIAANEAKNKDVRRDICGGSNDGLNAPKCIYGKQNKSQVSAIVMGDSHAMAVITAIGKGAGLQSKVVLSMVKDSCPTIFDRRYDGDKIATIQRIESCKIFNKQSFEYIDDNIQPNVPIISISRTSAVIMGPNDPGRERERQQALTSKFRQHNLSQITKSACEIQKNRQLYLMRPIPEIGINVPKKLSQNMLIGRGNEDIKITLDEYHERNKIVWEAQDEAAKKCGVKILNPLPYLCDDKYCYGSKNGRPLYYDDDHLSEYGNKFLVPMFEEIFK